ncbi:T9SS type A sorting domain-containing protein [Rubrivirga sp.]|uniref:T9SS type A sorting domain-containing protein n=1 Tax=Rubrivirga sp. TaxID=1885344 RepID=UPI003B52618D
MYPNPTAGPATVAVAVAEPSRVEVAVYDVLGRRVAGAVRALDPGAHAVPLGTGRLAPGVYVVRVTAEGPTGPAAETRRLTVTR